MTEPLALIIEDDPELSQIFSIALENDFAIEAVLDGAAALERLAQVIPTVIVLDLHLPGTSGKEILASIHADPRLAQTRVLLATADWHLAKTLQEEADVVLLKPISPMQLRELAARLKPVASR